MDLFSLLLEQTFVGNLTGQRVLEDILQFWKEVLASFKVTQK